MEEPKDLWSQPPDFFAKGRCRETGRYSITEKRCEKLTRGAFWMADGVFAGYNFIRSQPLMVREGSMMEGRISKLILAHARSREVLSYRKLVEAAVKRRSSAECAAA